MEFLYRRSGYGHRGIALRAGGQEEAQEREYSNGANEEDEGAAVWHLVGVDGMESQMTEVIL